MDRVSKPNYYLDIAATVAKRSTCLKKRFGAIIVKNDTIISTGYNGAPRGRQNCCNIGYCTKEKTAKSGDCRALHAEVNAIIAASREQMLDSTLYMVGFDASDNSLLTDICSCSACKRMIINAGIQQVVVRTSPTQYSSVKVRDWIFDDDSLITRG